MNAPSTLASLLELCFSDEDDDAGRKDLAVQFDAWPERAERFQRELADVVARRLQAGAPASWSCGVAQARADELDQA